MTAAAISKRYEEPELESWKERERGREGEIEGGRWRESTEQGGGREVEREGRPRHCLY